MTDKLAVIVAGVMALWALLAAFQLCRIVDALAYENAALRGEAAFLGGMVNMLGRELAGGVADPPASSD